MSYYIFDIEQEALAYDQAVTDKSNYQAPTVRWAEPRKHPALNKWAILVSPKVKIEGKETQELTEDWFES